MASEHPLATTRLKPKMRWGEGLFPQTGWRGERLHGAGKFHAKYVYNYFTPMQNFDPKLGEGFALQWECTLPETCV